MPEAKEYNVSLTAASVEAEAGPKKLLSERPHWR